MTTRARYLVCVPAGFVAALMMYPRAQGLGPFASMPRLELGTTGTVANALHFATREAASDARDLIARMASISGHVQEWHCTDKTERPAPSPDTGACPRCLTCRDSMHRAKACDCGAPLMRDCATCKHNAGGNCTREWCAPYSFLPGWEEAARA